MTTVTFVDGGYRYVPGVFQYSAGVAALPGHEIVRVRFRKPILLNEGFARIEDIVKSARRSMTSFCACELRSPEPFTEESFKEFNEVYVRTLERWGVFRNGVNPVARSNVCPELDKPKGPSFHAFCFTVEAGDVAPTFVVAGSGEAPEGRGDYRENTVRLGDTSTEGMREKARFVLSEMERRMTALGFGWNDTTAVQVYTVFDFHSFFADEVVSRGAASHGLNWHFNRPPVECLDYEMDCRGINNEQVV